MFVPAVQASAVAFVALGAWGAWTGWRQASPGERAAVVAILAVALALRLAAPAGPHDINPRSVAILAPQVDLATQQYGLMRPILWRLLLGSAWLGPHDVVTVAHATALWGAAVCVAVFAFVRGAGVPAIGAGTAAALVAVDPLLARFSHTDAPQIHELLPWWTGLAAWSAYTRTRDGRWAALGACGVALGAGMRPEGVLLLPVTALLAVALGRPLPRGRATAAALAWTVALPAAHLLLLSRAARGVDAARAGWGSFGPWEHGLGHWITFSPTHTPMALGALAAFGVVVAPGGVGRRVAWGAALLALGLFVPEAHWSPGVGDVPLLARHQLRMIPMAAVCAGFAAAWAIGRGRGAGWAVAAVAVALRLSDLHHLTTPYTIHAEHAFQRAAFAQVPDGCRVLTWRTPDDTGLVPDLGLSPRSFVDRWAYLDQPEATDPRAPTCTFWYRPALCDVARHPEDPLAGTDPCGDFEAAHDLNPVVETTLPVHPWLYDRLHTDPVRVGLYRVGGAR